MLINLLTMIQEYTVFLNCIQVDCATYVAFWLKALITLLKKEREFPARLAITLLPYKLTLEGVEI